jgi:hypothetical protein
VPQASHFVPEDAPETLSSTILSLRKPAQKVQENVFRILNR